MFESEPVQWLKKRNDKFLIISTLIISSIFFLSRIYEPSLSSDEAKYALIAKNMLISKNFLMPDLTLNLYLKKPPFFFWLIALSIKAFGTNEFAVRFPSAMFAVIDSILIYTLVRKITGDKLISFLSSMIFTVNFEVIRISTKDKLKDLRPLLKIGTSNFKNLGISKTIDIYTAYALLFYFPLETKQPKYLISRGKICEKAILKYGDYCIVKVKDENSPINHSYWMEWRN